MIPAALLACAANVSPVTLEAVVRVESHGNPLELHVNGLRRQPAPAASVPEATRIAQAYIQHGYSVDLGLMQVNSRNLAALGLTIEQALEPCTNVRAGAIILTANYAEAVRRHGKGQLALQAALSAYNTGDFSRGFANGYVARYYGPGSIQNAATATLSVSASASPPKRTVPHPEPALNPYTADSLVFIGEPVNGRIE